MARTKGSQSKHDKTVKQIAKDFEQKGYDVEADIRLIDKVIEVCHKDWLEERAIEQTTDETQKMPVFIVGLPRSGTTLTERILASHSNVESAGESYLLQIVIKQESRVRSSGNMSPKRVIIGMSAFLNACLRTTDDPLTPLARAVRI